MLLDQRMLPFYSSHYGDYRSDLPAEMCDFILHPLHSKQANFFFIFYFISFFYHGQCSQNSKGLLMKPMFLFPPTEELLRETDIRLRKDLRRVGSFPQVMLTV